MGALIVRRLVSVIPLLLLVSFGVFMLIALVPGDAAVTLAGGENATPQKIAGFYDVILPGLAARYQRYLAGTDRLLDEPTVRVMERILDEFSRMQNESRALRDELPQLQLNEKQRTARLAALEGADSDIVAHRAAAAVA